jgi:hypothetical protein
VRAPIGNAAISAASRYYGDGTLVDQMLEDTSR